MRFTKEAIVGLVFFAGLGLLVYVTMEAQLINPAGGSTLKVSFDQIEGLARGDTVWVDGLQMGTVREIGLEPKGGVVATLHLWQPITLHEGYTIRIQASAILGGKVVAIQRGDPKGAAIQAPALARGQTSEVFTKALEDLIAENRGNITAILTDFKDVMAKIRSGKGTIGRLVMEEELHENAKSLTGNLNAIVADIKEGKGTIGKLYKEDTLHKKAEEVLDHAAAIGRDLRAGKGTLGKLLQTDDLHEGAKGTLSSAKSAMEKLDKAIGDVQVVAQDLKEGKGTIGKLLRKDEVYDDVKKITANLRDVSDDLKAGKGTLGKLLKDDKLYEEARRVVARLRETLEDLREQVPVSSFTGVLFSAF